MLVSLLAVSAAAVTNADVGIAKSAPSSVFARSTFDYTITLRNNGPDTATDARFSDTLPAGITFVSVHEDFGPIAACNGGPTVTCTVPTLANGQSARFTITVQAPSTGMVVDNTATASASSNADPNPGNDSDTATTTIVTQVDLAITKSGPANAVNGTDVTYTIVVTNIGTAPAANVVMSEYDPPNTVFASETQNSGPAFNCSTTGQQTDCTIASFAPGDTAAFTVVIHLPSGLGATFMLNAAIVHTTSFEPNLDNNVSSVPTIITSQADVRVTKSVPPTAAIGSNVIYTVTVANAGPSDADSVTMTDTLPAGTTFVSESQTSGPPFLCTTGATVTCSILSLPAGASAKFNIAAAIDPATPNGTVLTNTATAGSSTTPDPSPNNNTAPATTTAVQTIPALSPLAMAVLAVALAMIGGMTSRS